jgi:hypothetical protein
MQPLTVLADIELSRVAGGEGTPPATTNDPSFGRCGPGSSWKWLGDVYTPQCEAHDAAVRGELAQGTPRWKAHLKALPLLPEAIGSYFRARFGQ